MKFKIKSKKIKNRFIYGDLLENKKAKNLIIFMSGFSGSREYPLFKASSKFFFNKDFSVITFNFCNEGNGSGQKDVIRPEEMKFPIYKEELKNVIDSFGKRYSRLILVGHSFGAVVSILFLNKYRKYLENAELILWEPSLLPWKKEWMKADFYLDKNKKIYHAKHSEEVMNRNFYQECIKIENTAKTFRSLRKAACIIAVKNFAEKNAKKYFTKIANKNKSKFLIMRGTEHSFKGKKYQTKLFNETLNFLEARMV